MCIIVDANRAGDFSNKTAHAPAISDALAKRQIKLVVGGELTVELKKTKLTGLINTLERAGLLVIVADHLIERTKNIVMASDHKSDDEHVLALAIQSGCRLIYTDDQLLIDDFKNGKIVNPVGSALKTSTDVGLLRRHYYCRKCAHAQRA